ncbi:MAG: pyruvate kinase [Burkholderiaceae bacterium]|jgi:pyruvate kinase|nr:pyruvate kinase [Burkholderiaceae bacterium]
MRRQRKAKIIATLGPSSSDRETILALFEAGVDVFRFNFSHGTQDDHRARYEIVREVERLIGRPIAILADLQGPKLRIGKFASGRIELVDGAEFTFDRDPKDGDESRVSLPHPELFNLMSSGHLMSLDDGKLRLEVIDGDASHIRTRVITGGPLSDRKGVNVPDVVLPIPILTEKDRRDLEFALSLGVDWVALSFVQRPEDLVDARRLIAGRAGLMTKLEKPAALDHLDEIVDASDAVMVARGDLGVELPPERVPGAQKRILRACRYYGKPAIVATQMLESMIHSPTPTRAEASDVASAIYDGTDAVMLSAESASGAYPVQAVSIMDRIINEVERDPIYPRMINAQHEMLLPSPRDAIFAALRTLTHVIRAVATVTYTDSGSTSLRAARERPMAPILSITPHLATARRLALAWGVHSTVMDHNVADVDEMVEAACRTAFAEGFGQPGDPLAIAAGMPFGQPGITNLLRVAEIPRQP